MTTQEADLALKAHLVQGYESYDAPSTENRGEINSYVSIFYDAKNKNSMVIEMTKSVMHHVKFSFSIFCFSPAND